MDLANIILNHSFFNYPVYEISDLGDNTQNLSINNHEILVFCKDDNSRAVTLESLNKIFAALKINMKDKARIVFLTPDVKFSLLTRIHTPLTSYVLLFGIAPAQLGLNLELNHYQAVKFKGLTFLTSADFATLEQNRALRLKLWQAIQAIFSTE